MTRQLLIIVAALATLGAACEPRPAADEKNGSGLDAIFEKEALIIVSDDGKRHRFDVYIAASYQQQRRGLMFVRKLPETTGMLFVYEEAGLRSMWMKNTFIPLDMIFARADGSVSSVIRDTVPQTLESQSSIEPVNFVLELNAGTARRLQIGKRSRLIRETGGSE